MDRESRIYVAGHRGLVGAAIARALREGGFLNLITRTHAELNLADQGAVNAFFEKERPEYVFLAAAKVGGIWANDSYPADFIRENLFIQSNVIDAAYRCGVRKLLFLGSSCIYPREAPQPIREDCLLTGPLESTNEWYAIAKITGIKMCQAYRRQYGFNAISLMPTNLYGSGDNFDLESSHVLPALIRKFHLAKLASQGDRQGLEEDEKRHGAIPAEMKAGFLAAMDSRTPASVILWGTGSPRREFLHVDDLAKACLALMDRYDSGEIVNVGTGEDLTIGELAEIVKEAVGYEGVVAFDASKPDGTPRKLLDVSRMQSLGWRPQIGLRDGIRQTYDWYRGASVSSLRR
ncbi:MAG: GDP-L-fucose synthase family protein [Syntrophobacteraceae bacterium]